MNTGYDDYVTDEAHGTNWTLYLGDSCERLAEIADNTVGLSVQSPPFASLFTFSPSMRDLGNCSTPDEFIEHYRYVIREQLRVTMPGRNACVHVQNLTSTQATHGRIGLIDFRGDVIRAFIEEGWIWAGEVTIWKNPQTQAIRTKSHSLMFVTKNRDSAMSRPALADYVLIFRKPGENTVPIKTDVTDDEWIEYAAPIWEDKADGGAFDADGNLCPVWYGIRETDTLNVNVAKDDPDERHMVPLQLSLIKRCVRLWSNPGELVLSTFAGIGSELYVAVQLGRRAVGCELKPSYWRTAVGNLTALESEMTSPALFDVDNDAVAS